MSVETGIRVRDRLAWLHVARIRLLSHFRLGDIMSDATGAAVHDCWKSYLAIPGTTPALLSRGPQPGAAAAGTARRGATVHPQPGGSPDKQFGERDLSDR